MITKKDIPFDLLKSVESIAQQNLDLIKLKKEINTYYLFVETDFHSKNYFKIYQDGTKVFGNFNSADNYVFEHKPTDSANPNTAIVQGNLEKVMTNFKNWLELVKSIVETPSIHDDNFEKFYSDYYFNEFKILDEDSNFVPFNPIQQDKIELYLISLKSAIENSNYEIDEETKAELIIEIEEVRTALPLSTKTKVMKGVTKIFGKLFKTSKEFAKEIIIEAKKELINKLIELGIQYGPKLLEVFEQQQHK
ncbi:hypothetical protein [Flavobacterium psychrophilum]|uniref:hypothetical protein n=1 Tax=Flavobacterium psychrophilum TaxID=96345 RepID=UPI000B7C464F|nr:hypothetical protein [Flavobacterium psychrophilum]MCB5983467.1 hypothetical protein [Flavobacterium psychrophilum]MCB5994309.1 hypothetical protein [Flavobacterium psychrophilum]MCB5996484.1 hypothetical protein [Flavobacterium psychrophilum]MCB6004035.1 hypothetical protein [Flavobacterium psychrophilum]MCB6006500.1 hypothetical protein [Flavobacterium psychrophilum]